MENMVLKGRRLLRILILLGIGALGCITRYDLTYGAKKLQPFLMKVGPGWALLLVGIVLALWPFPKEEKKGVSLTSLLYLLVSPAVGYLTAELVTTDPSGKEGIIEKMFGPTVFSLRYASLNLLVIAILILFFIAITGSFKMGPLLGTLLIILFSIVNYYVYEFRGVAITASDFASIGTAANVASGFRPTFNARVYTAVCVMAFWWMVAFRIRRHYHTLPEKKMAYFTVLVGGLCLFALCVKLFILSTFLTAMGIRISYFNTMNKSYRNRGTALIIARSVREASPSKPDGYTIQEVEAIAARYRDPETAGEEKEVPQITVSEENPNIIVVIDEAFCDLQTVGEFEINEDDMPFLHSLEEKGLPVGRCYVSGLGGRTANTEFEFLTGMTMAFLPQDSYPFQIYIKDEIPSLANILKNRGYAGIQALHPAAETNYRRNVVYPLLGFDHTYFQKNLPVKMQKIRWLASDETVFNNIEYLFEETRQETDAPYFFYTMTIQNHSDYNTHQIENTIWPVGLKKDYDTVSQYMSLVSITDAAFEKLCEYFEQTGEPTVIVFMGDHQPKVPSGFLKETTADKDFGGVFQEKYNQYNVTCWFWSNFPLKEGVDLSNTSTNYMSLNLFRLIGAELTPFQQFQLDLQEYVKAINGFGYMGADGNNYGPTNTSSPYYDKLHEYLMLCYNDMFEGNNRLKGFFE